MKPESSPDPEWNKLSASLREAGVATRPDGEDLSAPHGFAVRVVAGAHSNERANATSLHLWRRWSLAGAATAFLLFGGATLLPPAKDPITPIIPIPALESQTPQLSSR